MGHSYLRNTLLVLSSEENGPGNTTGVLALEEEGFGLSILESEDLAVATDVEFALLLNHQHFILSNSRMPVSLMRPYIHHPSKSPPHSTPCSREIRTFPG